MTKRRGLEERLAELNDLRGDPSSDLAIEKLRQALASKINHLAAEAATITGESEIRQLEDDLIEAFDRFMLDPAKTDPLCVAKTAIAEALYRLGARRESLFLRGIHHVQLEPGFGRKEDAAAKLRVACAMGLVRSNYRDVMIELADLLADEETDARIGAVRAIGYAQQGAGVPLLRFKSLIGDPETRVSYECFSSLLRLSPESSLPFVARFLNAEDVAVSKVAALALGESQLTEAFYVLKAGWESATDDALRRAELLAIAMLRHERAIDFLLSLVADASPADARDGLTALEIHRRDEELWARVEQIVKAREDVDLS